MEAETVVMVQNTLLRESATCVCTELAKYAAELEKHVKLVILSDLSSVICHSVLPSKSKTCRTLLCILESLISLSYSPNSAVSFAGPALSAKVKFVVHFFDRQRA